MDGFAPSLGDMSSEEFRRYGRSLVDWIADYFDRVDQYPVLAQVEPGALIAKLPAAPPGVGEPMDRILADVDRLVVPALTQWRHPGIFAYFACSTSAPGIFGEMLAAAFNGNALLWRAAPAAQDIEDVALSWLRQMIGPRGSRESSTTRLRCRPPTPLRPRARRLICACVRTA